MRTLARGAHVLRNESNLGVGVGYIPYSPPATTRPDTVSYRLPVPVSFATYSHQVPGNTFSVGLAALRLHGSQACRPEWG